MTEIHEKHVPAKVRTVCLLLNRPGEWYRLYFQSTTNIIILRHRFYGRQTSTSQWAVLHTD